MTKNVKKFVGLKFGRLPPILSVQLKRFVYDFSGETIVQKKLNDQVKFPMILDMNKYVATRTVQTDGDSAVVSNEEFEEFLKEQLDVLTKKSQESSSSSATDHGLKEEGSASKVSYGESLYDVDLTATTSANLYGDDAFTEDTHVKMESSCEKNTSNNASVNYDSMTEEEVQQLIKDRGEWIYELYAVLIHSGAITGGHYFAYIKDLDSKRWWSFNDSNVTPIDESTVREAWGGPIISTVNTYRPYGNTYGNYYTGTYTSTYYSNPTPTMSSSNAYMLMYRKVCSDPSNAVSFPSDDLVPEHVKSIIRQEEELKASRLKADLEWRNRLFVKVFWNSTEHSIRCQKSDTYGELMEILWNTLKLDVQCANVSSNSSCSTQSLKSPAMLLDLPKPPADNDNHNTHNTTVNAPRPDSPSSYGAVGDKSEMSEVTTIHDMSDFHGAEPSAEVAPLPEVSKFSLFRMRPYNQYTFVKSEPIDFEVSKLMTLSDLGFTDYRTYMVETRKPGESWELFHSDGYTLLLQEFDGVSFSFKDPRSVRFQKGFTLRDVKEAITKWVVYPEDCIQLLKVSNIGLYDARKEILIGDDKPLSELCTVTDAMKLIFERIDNKQSVGDEIRSVSSISTSTGGELAIP